LLTNQILHLSLRGLRQWNGHSYAVALNQNKFLEVVCGMLLVTVTLMAIWCVHGGGCWRDLHCGNLLLYAERRQR
jgi:hypothetical protein